MSSISIILSSAGLKNVFPKQSTGEEFEFVFGDRKMKMDNIFADFISPVVSNLHLSDPTANSIDFTKQINGLTFTDEVFSLIQLLSKGTLIEIKDEQFFQIQAISVLLGNEELFSLINDKIDNINDSNLDQYLTNLKILSQISPFSNCFNYKSVIDYIASHFSSIDENKIISLPQNLIYSIISNENLVIDSEDSLLEFIEKIFNQQEEDDEDDDEIISFYEEIRFNELSENKFNEFIEKLSASKMTEKLWQNLRKCFYTNMKNQPQQANDNRYSFKRLKFEYDGNESHRFEGIIHHLTEKCGGNVADKGIVNVTASSTNSNRLPKNSVDLTNMGNYFQSSNQANSWIKYDFINSKVQPTHYSIRNRHDYNGCHLRNWVIEGSNSGGENENEWTVLDSHQNDATLEGQNFSHTFEIKSQQAVKNGYRYLRIRQTGPESNNANHLTFSAIEFFGSLIEQ